MNEEEERVPAWGDPDYGAWAERKRRELDEPSAQAKSERRNKATPHPVMDVEAMRERQESE
jgi:hypothetical protein